VTVRVGGVTVSGAITVIPLRPFPAKVVSRWKDGDSGRRRHWLPNARESGRPRAARSPLAA